MQSNTSTIMKSSLSRISTVATLMYSYLLSLIYWGFYSLFALIVGCILLETVYRLIVSCELLQKTQFGDSVRVDSNTANAKTIHLFGISIPLSEEGVRFVTIVRAWMVENVFEFGILLLPKTFLKALDTIAVATHKDPRNPTGELKSPLKLSPTRARQRATSAYNASAVAISINGLGPLDFKRCYMCNKKFSYMTRSKHYCGKCNHNFCRRCAGHIDHVWPTPCKVNSRCLCNKCLLLAKPEHD